MSQTLETITTFGFLMLSMFGIYDRTVTVGFSDELKKDTANGIAMVYHPERGVQKLLFTVNKPSVLNNPRPYVVADIFSQLRKLGYKPTAIELTGDKLMHVFKEGKPKPILKQTRALA